MTFDTDMSVGVLWQLYKLQDEGKRLMRAAWLASGNSEPQTSLVVSSIMYLGWPLVDEGDIRMAVRDESAHGVMLPLLGSPASVRAG
jgi:hypothetical protein